MIFSIIFKLPSKKIKGCIKKFRFKELDNKFFIQGDVIKITVNDTPSEIRISWYYTVKIEKRGIWFLPEHGEPIELLNFSKVGKLNDLLKKVKEVK